MMLPSLAPTAVAFEALVRHELSRGLFAGSLAWDSSGRWFAAGALALAALYPRTPLKRAFLLRCRSPMRFLETSWQNTRSGAPVLARRGVRSAELARPSSGWKPKAPGR